MFTHSHGMSVDQHMDKCTHAVLWVGSIGASDRAVGRSIRWPPEHALRKTQHTRLWHRAYDD